MREGTIRRLTPDDAAIFRGIRLEGLLNHPEAFGADYEAEAARPLAATAARLADTTVLGGFSGDGMVQGIMGLVRDKSPKTRHIATIWGVYVRPALRGTGLARHLLDAAIAEAFRDCLSIRLSVSATNRAARQLYLRAGFVEWALDARAMLVDGVFHDEILMRLDRKDP